VTPEEKRLAKIAALLAKARDPAASEKEAEIYAQHAAKLMARHSITDAMLSAAHGVEVGVIERMIKVTGEYGAERVRLLGCIAAALHCRSVKLSSRSSGIPMGAIVMGAPKDVERTLTLFELLDLQGRRGMMTDSAEVFGYHRVHTYRKNWLRGYGDVVARRLKAIEDRMTADVEAEQFRQSDNGLWLPEGKSTALVLADRDRKVDDYYDDKWSHVDKPPHDHATAFEPGAVEGARQGRRADIGLTKMEGQ
jgi:hypothetical protein